MDRQLNICDLEVVLRFIGHLLEVMLTKAVSFALNRQWFRCIIRYFATSILKIITQCFFMFFCVYHSFFQLASFYRIELFQPCIKAFPYRHFCFLTSVFSLFRSKVTELLFQKEKLVAVCQTNFSRDHAGDFLFLRKKRLFDFFLGIDIQQLQLFPTLRLASSPFRDES